MSWIGNSPRPPAELAQLAAGIEGQGGYAAPSGTGASPPWANPGDAILGFAGGGAQPAAYDGSGLESGGLGGAMSGFFGLIGSLFAQIQQYLGQALGVASSSPAATPTSNLGGAPSPNPAGGPPSHAGQTFYGSADASSVGDPHEAFSGTTGAGDAVNGTWDSMSSHRDLLDSDSFNGGYRVSTQATQPNSNGVTLNQSATVTTASGNTTVTLDANGQYAVTAYGRNVSLQQGQSADLGGGESVTLNPDNSLTVNDSNGQGGSITTTLAANGSGGVDVKTHASEVELGGYLTGRGDGAAAGPGRRFPHRRVHSAALASQFAAPPRQEGPSDPEFAASGSWAGGDPLRAEQNVDPLLAG
ncbi:MAG: hypothetical protein WAJ85_07485 [Candidatus Baltobacteraceae bacterium]|jgi:hypothetical protein